MLADGFQSFRALHRNARLYLLSNIPQAMTAGALGVLYTLYLTALGYGTDFIGVVAVVGTIGAGLGILPANRLVARLGWRATLIWSDVIGGIAIAAQLVAPTRPVIVVTTLGIGASVALVLVVNTPLLAAFSAPEQRTALFGLNNALVFLATVVGSLLGGFLPGFFLRPGVRASAVFQLFTPLLVSGSQAQAYELALIVTGVIALPSIVPVLLMTNRVGEGGERNAEDAEGRGEGGRGEGRAGEEGASSAASSPRRRTSRPRALQREPSRLQPLGAGAEVVAERGAVERERLPWQVRVAPRLRELRVLASGVIGRFAVTQGLVGFGAGIFFPYVNLYFVNRLGASTEFYGALSALLSVVVAAASLAAVPLARHFGTLRAAIVAQLVSLPCLLAIGAIPVLAVASVVYLLRGGLMATTSPPLQSYLMEAVPAEQRVPASSAYNVSFQVCWALGAGFGGWLITLAGYRAPFLAAVPFYALSAVLLIVWFGGKRLRMPQRLAAGTEGSNG
ncbi:MAG: MFS transporter [Ktedonobacterales bacterium]